MSKTVVLMLFALLLLSTLVVVGSAFAQSIPKPYVPEFIVRFVESSYNVTTIDLYTGLNVTEQFENNTLEVVIENQPFFYSWHGLSYNLYYNVRTKPHFAENWTEIYPIFSHPNSPYDWDGKSWSYSEYIFDPDSHIQSASGFTILPFDLSGDDAFYLFIGLTYGDRVDFQVEAIVGHDSQIWRIEHPFTPEYGGYYDTAVAFDITSGWSETQTIAIGDSQTPSPEPTFTPEPTATPYGESQPADQQVILGVAVTVAVVVVGLSLLFYLIKRK